MYSINVLRAKIGEQILQCLRIQPFKIMEQSLPSLVGVSQSISTI